MQAIVLAAGYATRLYPLTLDCPKAALRVAGKQMITRVVDSLSAIESLTCVWAVSNERFRAVFEKWHRELPKKKGPEVRLLIDGSTSEKDKLGAIGDLLFALKAGNIDDDVVVAAADNIFSGDLREFGEFAGRKNASVLGVYDTHDLSVVPKYSEITLKDDDSIVGFQEKPKTPKTTLIGIALYYYPKHVLPLIQRYADEGNNLDQPGRLPEWLHKRTTVYAWRVPGQWYDIGSQETLEEANQVFSQLQAQPSTETT